MIVGDDGGFDLSPCLVKPSVVDLVRKISGKGHDQLQIVELDARQMASALCCCSSLKSFRVSDDT